MPVDTLTKLQYNKLLPIKYSTNDGVVRESLVSFHEMDGTFSSLEFHEGSASVISEPLADLGSLRGTSSTVSALAYSCDGQRVAVGYKDGSSRIYSFTADSLMLSSKSSSLHPFFTLGGVTNTDDDDNDDVTFVAGPRFQSCVRDLAFDPRSSAESGYFLALASEDYTCGVCVVNVSSDMSERYLLDCSSRYGGVRSLAYTPTVENDTVFLVAIGMDGKVTFYTCMGLDQPDVYWDVLHHETTPAIPLKDIGGMITHTDSGASAPHDGTAVALFSKATLPVWSPDGSILAIPGLFDVQLRLREDVTKKYYLLSSATRKEGHYLGEIVACTMYQELLVSLGRDGTACLWKLDQGTVKRLLQDPSLRNTTTSLGHFQKAMNTGNYPTSIIFLSHINRLQNAVCIQSATGECQLLTNLLTTVAAATSEESSIRQDTRKKNKPKILEENESDQESIHFDTQPIRKPNLYVDDAAKEDDDEVESLALNEAHSTTDTVLSDGLATQEYNDDFPHDVDGDDHLEFREDNVDLSNNIYYSHPKPQEAFAPSSTPLHHDAIDARRILCWNHVGVATSRHDSMRGGKIIDINFTDVLSGGGFKTFSDTYGFEIGSLSEEGSIFATHPEDSDTGSRIYYFRFETIGLQHKKDWTMTLPNGEGVLGCACGEGWAAVVTNRRFLRLFGSGGLQRTIVYLKGSPVTMAGRGRFLAVVYHESIPLPDKTQQLGFMLLDGVEGEMICTGSLSAVGCGQQLTWIGLSNDYALTVMDSGGMLSMLNKLAGWQWTPMLDTLGKKKSEDDSFWPVTVLDGKLICIPLKGGHEHPDATRRPVTTALDLKMPLANSVLKKSFQLEETCARASVSLMQKRFINELLQKEGADPIDLEEDYTRSCAQIDKVTLRLFHESLQANLYERALDVVIRLHLEKSFDIALTISEQFRSRALSDRIEMIKIVKFSSLNDFEESHVEVSKLSENGERNYERSVEFHSRRISPDSRDVGQASGKKRKASEGADEAACSGQQNSQQTTPSKGLTSQPKLNPFYVKRQFSSPNRMGKNSAVVATNSPKSPLFRNSTFGYQSKEETKTKKKFL